MALSKRKDPLLDPFKRAVTLATRAIAADNEVEVVFSNEPAGLSGKLARLPEPSRIPTRGELAVIRGHADAAALSVACHDPKLHARLAPGTRAVPRSQSAAGAGAGAGRGRRGVQAHGAGACGAQRRPPHEGRRRQSLRPY